MSMGSEGVKSVQPRPIACGRDRDRDRSNGGRPPRDDCPRGLKGGKPPSGGSLPSGGNPPSGGKPPRPPKRSNEDGEPCRFIEGKPLPRGERLPSLRLEPPVPAVLPRDEDSKPSIWNCRSSDIDEVLFRLARVLARKCLGTRPLSLSLLSSSSPEL